MKSDFQRGVKIGLSIYGIGIVLTVIVHLIFGWDYPHGPPTSAIPLFLTFVVGGLRLLFTALMTMAEKSQKAKGDLTVHIAGGNNSSFPCMAETYGDWLVRPIPPKGLSDLAPKPSTKHKKTETLTFDLAGALEISYFSNDSLPHLTHPIT